MDNDNLNYWILEKKDEIYYLKVNNPKKRNAFNEDLVEEFYQIISNLKNNASIRVLVLTSESNDFFCSGADINWFYGADKEEGERISVRSHEIFGGIEELPFPVIAAIKGLNLTAGLEMSIACDIIIAADNAKFGQIETKWGLTPGGGGTQRLTQLIGPLKTRELIYTAKIIDAMEAKRIGLVNEVVPLSEIDEYVHEICEEILKNSKRAVKESKFLIQKAIYTSKDGFNSEERVFGEDFDSGEPKERFFSFIQKSKKSDKK